MSVSAVMSSRSKHKDWDIIQTALIDIGEDVAGVTDEVEVTDATEPAPVKRKRGRPSKNKNSEAIIVKETKRRGRPPKVTDNNEVRNVNTALKTATNDKNLVFALDIGTRSIIGIVAEEQAGGLKIIATERLEHRTRAMLDGQIHDVPQVAAIIKEVKDKLTLTTGTLKNAAVAAAGRALYTMTAEADMAVSGLITAEEQRDLDFAGVQAAQRKLASSQTVDDHTRYYCVGYSTISYTLDDSELKTLVGQRGRKARAKVIATFLPRQVVDSMQSALNEAGLDMKALTLEPIAGINVLIPPTMRHLNLTLVDIGAGTSDVAITKNGSVVAYGMVPLAGDEITEAISREYLLDFNVAEGIKRQINMGGEATFTDILGASLTMDTATILEAVKPNINNLAESIAKEILSLNGEAPQAVMLVGGGALTPLLPELVAKALDMPANRVAVRYPENVEGIIELPAELKTTDAVTPLGILKIASINTLHFLAVWINEVEYSLFNFRELTVSDALLAAGIGLRKYNGRPGMGLMVSINGKKRTFPGTMGSLAEITIDDKKANLDTPIYDDCRLKITSGEDGVPAEIHLSDVVNIHETCTVTINGEERRLKPYITLNGDEVEGDPLLKDNDIIKSRNQLTLGEVLKKENLPPAGRKISYLANGKKESYTVMPTMKINGEPKPISTVLADGDEIEYIAGESPKIKDVLKIADTETAFNINYEGKERQISTIGVNITVNGEPANSRTVVDDGAVIEYSKAKNLTMNVSEALLAVGFTPPPANSKVTVNILVNGERAEFTAPIMNGDTLEVKISPIENTGDDEETSSGIPTAGAALSSIRQGHTDTGNKAGNGITIEDLMRYD